jgi:predicted DNA-binding protein with PD1-like motif
MLLKRKVSMIQARSENELLVRLVDGEELTTCLAALKVDSGVILNGVGMLRKLELAFWSGSGYETTPIDEPVELLSLQGNFACKNEERMTHCHATVARRDGAAFGGHVIKATVHNTTEIFIRELSKIKLERRPEESGLAGLYPSVR